MTFVDVLLYFIWFTLQVFYIHGHFPCILHSSPMYFIIFISHVFYSILHSSSSQVLSRNKTIINIAVKFKHLTNLYIWPIQNLVIRTKMFKSRHEVYILKFNVEELKKIKFLAAVSCLFYHEETNLDVKYEYKITS